VTLALLLSGGGANAADWEQINEDEGIRVFRKDIPNSDLVAFMGTTVMEQPLERIVAVLANNDRRIEWVDRLYISTVLERTSDFDYIVYQAFGLPAILSNRDYVYHGRATRNAETGVVTLEMSSVEHRDAPETVGVRAHLINSRYRLEPLDAGHTRVTVEIHTDPKGWIPTWLVNLIQKSWPLKTLSSMRAQAAKPDVKPHALPPVDTSVATSR
jgi:hypothetical protein